VAYAIRKARYFQWTGGNVAEMRQLDPDCESNEDGTLHVNRWFPGLETNMPVGAYLAEAAGPGTGPKVYLTEAELLVDFDLIPEE
jgi:hypothetical protein